MADREFVFMPRRKFLVLVRDGRYRLTDFVHWISQVTGRSPRSVMRQITANWDRSEWTVVRGQSGGAFGTLDMLRDVLAEVGYSYLVNELEEAIQAGNDA